MTSMRKTKISIKKIKKDVNLHLFIVLTTKHILVRKLFSC